MSATLIWSNFVAYSLQIGLLVGVAAVAPAALRLRSAKAKLAYWHLLLAACLLLPAIRPWQRRMVAETVTVTSRVIATGPSDAPVSRRYSPTEIALAVVVVGAMARLGWLAAGLWRLRRYRKGARPFVAELPWDARVDVRVAPELASPVTFGALRPVILLPLRFPDLDAKAREAILCHELLHVQRGDWLFTVAEEVVRAAFWFHPAIWWLLGEIQLAREQAVDREVIARTNARDEYLDALLAIAGAKAQLDLAPAPLFLRKRHLKHRVVSILKESRMSRTKLFSALTASVCVLAAGCWLVTNTFPLAAAPQVASDSPGVTVDVGGAALLHRAPVEYPAAAREKGIQGSVAVELTFDASGNVADARVLSGPEELRKAALQSALQWHFTHETAGNKRVVTIGFQLPAAGSPTVQRDVVLARPTLDTGMTPQQTAQALKALSELQKTKNTPELTARIAALQKELEEAPNRARTKRVIKSINIYGLSEDAKSEVMSKVNLRVGNSVTAEEAGAALDALRGYDEHLKSYVTYVGPEELAITIMAPSAAPAITDDPQRLKIGGNMQSTKLIRQPRPAYPPEAKAARIQGVVKLSAVIGKDGTVLQLEVISGHPLLVASALEAVRQWVYEPTLLNGNPVEVQTQIDVNYTLSQ
jgi:TonB family protein